MQNIDTFRNDLFDINTVKNRNVVDCSFSKCITISVACSAFFCFILTDLSLKGGKNERRVSTHAMISHVIYNVID